MKSKIVVVDKKDACSESRGSFLTGPVCKPG
jgi:hypothetical protein